MGSLAECTTKCTSGWLHLPWPLFVSFYATRGNQGKRQTNCHCHAGFRIHFSMSIPKYDNIKVCHIHNLKISQWDFLSFSYCQFCTAQSPVQIMLNLTGMLSNIDHFKSSIVQSLGLYKRVNCDVLFPFCQCSLLKYFLLRLIMFCLSKTIQSRGQSHKMF
jgi:hypothetical protein